MKELLEALSVAMIAEGTKISSGGPPWLLPPYDAATASMLKGFGRALGDAATKLSPSKAAKNPK